MNQKGYKSKWKLDLIPFFLFLIPIIASCVTTFTPQATLEDRQLKREEMVEDYLSSQFDQSKNYSSLGFGPLNVIKPPAFVRLDSLYDIKYAYLENNDLKSYKLSGIEELIEDYKANAQSQSHLLKYELEHIYATATEDSLRIHHDYFVLNERDSIIGHTPFYQYSIPYYLKKYALNYLFELHFLSQNEVYVTEQELNFIRFFKEKERTLIRTEELDGFMSHVTSLMYVADLVNSVDFVNLSKVEAVKALKDSIPSSQRFEHEDLFVLETDQEEVTGYTLDVTWYASDTSEQKIKTRFFFDAYLRIENQLELEE